MAHLPPFEYPLDGPTKVVSDAEERFREGSLDVENHLGFQISLFPFAKGPVGCFPQSLLQNLGAGAGAAMCDVEHQLLFFLQPSFDEVGQQIRVELVFIAVMLFREQGGSLAGINPYDIASIKVLKDATDLTMYGSRGANGVILITMKRAKSGAPDR